MRNDTEADPRDKGIWALHKALYREQKLNEYEEEPEISKGTKELLRLGIFPMQPKIKMEED